MIQELDPNQNVEVHIHFLLMEYDFPKLMVRVQVLWVRELMLVQEGGPNWVRIEESI